MNSRPWDADRPLTLEVVRAIIGARFPEVDSRSLDHLGSGWDFDAFLTADGWVFRFPRRSHCADLFEPESRVHHLVARFLPSGIAVPKVELIGQPAMGFPYRFAGHRLIAGIAADAIDEHLRAVLPSEIGAALDAIHSIPEDAARMAGVVEFDVDDQGRNKWFERGLAVVSELRGFDPTIDQALSWVSRLSSPFLPFNGPLRFIHHDLSPEHLIVDARTGQLTGILDWTDAILGDAARDFVSLVVWRGWGFAEEVLNCYRAPVDEGFRERLRFMARLLSVMWLAEAHERSSDVAKHTAWVGNAFATAG